MIYYRTDELYHHGIKGMKWGVRRYQNPDGTLTQAGQKRYYGRADRIQKDIDSFKGHENGIYTKSGKQAMSSKEVSDSVKALENLRDKAKAKGDKKREADAWKGLSRKEKLASQNYQKYGKGNLPGQGIVRHYVNNAKYWKQAMSDIKQTKGALNRAKKYVNAYLDQPMTLSGFTGIADTTLRKRFSGQSYELY